MLSDGAMSQLWGYQGATVLNCLLTNPSIPLRKLPGTRSGWLTMGELRGTQHVAVVGLQSTLMLANCCLLLMRV